MILGFWPAWPGVEEHLQGSACRVLKIPVSCQDPGFGSRVWGVEKHLQASACRVLNMLASAHDPGVATGGRFLGFWSRGTAMGLVALG